MKKIFIIVFIICSNFIGAENSEKQEKFEGFWTIDAQYNKNNDFLIIEKIEDKYLILDIGIKDKQVSKGIGKLKDFNTIEVLLWEHKFFIKWFKENKSERIEMYVNPDAEDYSIYKRVNTFSLNKF